MSTTNMAAIRYNICLLIVFVSLLYIGGGECSGGGQKRFVLEEDYSTIISKLNNLTQKVTQLEKETELLRHQPASFMAYLSKTIPGQNHQIIFDDVKLNIGNRYHVTHGNFIAPINGLYQFAITACSATNHYIVLELTVNTAVVGKVLAGDTVYHDCNTGVFLQSLSAGDDVYVQHETTGDYLLSNIAYGRPSFSGVLLYAL